METTNSIQSGISEETTFIVEDQHTASQIGSGSLKVLSTPYLITVMEKTCHQLLAKRLPEGLSSVGAQVNVRHLAPTPLGSQVRVRVEVIQAEGNRITFSVQAWDQTEKISEGEHLRIVIDVARFLNRVAAKQASLG
jgi:fluoroacetyl-CoA thioesterase